jgi:superfamily II DNA or RNA helicase
LTSLHSSVQRRLLAEELTRLRRADERLRFAVSQRSGRIDPNPHQIDAVVFALQRIPEGGCILADEVGLGKTIEAGLVIAQLLAEGRHRILLIVPKALVGQWQTEMYSLFGIQVREGGPDPEAFAGPGVFIVHREFAGGLKGAPLISSADPFDLVVIDEAHEVFAGIYKRFDKAGNYKSDASEAQIADRVRSFLKLTGTPVLLLTATPIQNSLTELWGLVQYVEPTNELLGQLPTFRDVFCDGSDRGLNVEQSFELKRRLNTVVQRTLRRQAQEFLEVPFVERQARLIEFSMGDEEKKLYEHVTAWLMDPYSCAFSPKNRRLLLIGFHRRMASSLAALRASLDRVAERLRRQLGTVEQNEVGNDVLPDDIFDRDEVVRDFAAEFDEDIEDILHLAEVQGASPVNQLMGGDQDSSNMSPDTEPRDDEPLTVARLREELARIQGFLDEVDAVPRDSKAESLLGALRVIQEHGESGDGSGKVVIFTESIRTQESLFELLTSHGYAPGEVTLFRGDNNHPRAKEAYEQWMADVGLHMSEQDRPSRSIAVRLALIHEFRERSRVLISTEAGGKGLNLQFCETLINYDLPWNPQRIEQRIGRVHRYGQKRGVTVLNFLDRGNEAQRLTFEILSQKLDLFGKVLDASDVVLHEPTTDAPEPLIGAMGVEFESRLRQIYRDARSIEDVTEQLRELRQSMDSKRKAFDEEQSRAASLISMRLDGSVRQVFAQWQAELPEGLAELDRDLDRLLAGFLQATGAEFERSESAGHIVYQIKPDSRHQAQPLNHVAVFIGSRRDAPDGEAFQPGHPLFIAAVEEARRATEQPCHVVWELPAAAPDSLKELAGNFGQLVVTKLSCRGFESVDCIIVTMVLAAETEPLDGTTTSMLLQHRAMDIDRLSAGDECDMQRVDEDVLEDAIDDAVLDEQLRISQIDEERFLKKLETLDRYLDDQVLVLRRQQATLARKLDDETVKQQRATSPTAESKAKKAVESLEGDIRSLDEKIERLRQGEDADYQQWRQRLFERRFNAPEIDRLVEASFEIRLAGDSIC